MTLHSLPENQTVDIMIANWLYFYAGVLLHILFESFISDHPLVVVGFADRFHFFAPGYTDSASIAPPVCHYWSQNRFFLNQGGYSHSRAPIKKVHTRHHAPLPTDWHDT